MKLLVCFIVVLCAAGSLADPLLRRRCLGCRGKVGLLGAILGGGGYSERVDTRVVEQAPAPAPAPAPSVNVNVRNVYNNQDRKEINNDNRVGQINNNRVNNNLDYRQNINNRAVSNVNNDERVYNRAENNNYAPYTECQTGEC